MTAGAAHSHVVLITTGGTIASTRDEAAGGLVPNVSAEALFRAAGSSVAVEVRSYKNVLGTALSPEDLFTVASMASAALSRDDVTGVVVTAGTGIIEEGAYLGELLNGTEKPVVWTGAQVGLDCADSDGPRNLRNSLQVAACQTARGSGARAMVCFNDEVVAARDAVKVHKTNRAAFSGLDRGLLGRVDWNGITWIQRAIRRRAFAVERLDARVDLIKLVSGSDSRFFHCAIDSGARGIVVEAFPGVGVVSPGTIEGIQRARQAGLSVVLSSRSPLGSIAASYGTELGGGALVRYGVLPGGDLCPVKLRLLLMVALSVAKSEEEVRQILSELVL